MIIISSSAELLLNTIFHKFNTTHYSMPRWNSKCWNDESPRRSLSFPLPPYASISVINITPEATATATTTASLGIRGKTSQRTRVVLHRSRRRRRRRCEGRRHTQSYLIRMKQPKLTTTITITTRMTTTTKNWTLRLSASPKRELPSCWSCSTDIPKWSFRRENFVKFFIPTEKTSWDSFYMTPVAVITHQERTNAKATTSNTTESSVPPWWDPRWEFNDWWICRKRIKRNWSWGWGIPFGSFRVFTIIGERVVIDRCSHRRHCHCQCQSISFSIWFHINVSPLSKLPLSFQPHVHTNYRRFLIRLRIIIIFPFFPECWTPTTTTSRKPSPLPTI